jgi:NADH-quinone oxidoreductase subunit K
VLTAYLLVGAVLFALGMVGFVTRRNLIIVFLCTEMMFQGIVVTLVAFGRYPLGTAGAALDPLAGFAPASVDGQVFSLFLLSVAAAEAALGLALVVLLFRHKGSLDPQAWTALRDD